MTTNVMLAPPLPTFYGSDGTAYQGYNPTPGRPLVGLMVGQSPDGPFDDVGLLETIQMGPLGFGKRILVPIPASTPDTYVEVEGPPWWSALALFALGWAGGYVTWSIIAKKKYKGVNGLMGLSGTPAEHRERAQEYLAVAEERLRDRDVTAAGEFAAMARAEMRWTGQPTNRRLQTLNREIATASR